MLEMKEIQEYPLIDSQVALSLTILVFTYQNLPVMLQTSPTITRL